MISAEVSSASGELPVVAKLAMRLKLSAMAPDAIRARAEEVRSLLDIGPSPLCGLTVWNAARRGIGPFGDAAVTGPCQFCEFRKGRFFCEKFVGALPPNPRAT